MLNHAESTSVVSLVIPDEIMVRIERLRSGDGPRIRPRSSVLRRALDIGLAALEAERTPSVPVADF